MFQRLDQKKLTKLHEASLEIMEKTGLRMLDSDALELLKKGGCVVGDDGLVKFPAKLIEWAIKAAPRQIKLYDQKGDEAIDMNGRCSYFGNGSDLLYIIDHKTGKRRKPVLQDVCDIVKLIDSLPFMDFVMSGFIPSDVPSDFVQRRQMQAMLQNTNKPIVYVTTDLSNTQHKVAMAEIVAGGAKNLQERPFAANYINISNPLRQAQEAIQKLMWLSEKGLPFVYRPSIVTRGISTPVTWAGFLVVNNIAGLAGLVLSQLVREGAPFIRCGCSGGTFDMKTMVGQHSASEIRGFNEDMAENYGLPRFGIGGLCGAKEVDQQAAFEAALTLMVSVQSGAQLIHDVGYMDNGTTGSLEQLMICQEIIGWVKQYMKDLVVNEETLALDAIDEVVKADSDFMQTDNTLMHYKEDYYPELTDRGIYTNWQAAGSLTLRDRAKNEVEEILGKYQPEQKSENILNSLDDYISESK